MTGNLFNNAKFGDMFLTTENKQAVFLRLAENAEYKFAVLYIEDWGIVQVLRHNGKEIHNDIVHSVVGKQKEPVIEDLEEAAKLHIIETRGEDVVWDENARCAMLDFKAGVKWQKEQMMKGAIEVDVMGYGTGWLSLGYLPECEHDFKEGDKVKIIIVKEN